MSTFTLSVAGLQAKEMLPLTQNEAFVGTCFGRMWFLPIGWRTMRHLPKGQVEVSNSIVGGGQG